MKLFKVVLSASLALVSLSAKAQDVTQEIINQLSTEFIGVETSANREWDNTFCAVPNPLGGCIEKGGTKIYGSAKGKATEFLGKTGNGWYLGITTNPWSGVKVIEHWVDLKLSFAYRGESEGRKQCWPGNYACGMEWGTLNPAGKVVTDITADGNRVTIEMTYEVFQGNGDKPNAVMRDAMLKLAPKMQELIQRFVKRQGSDAVVVVKKNG